MDIKFIPAADSDKDYLLNLRKQTMVEHLEKAGFYLSDDEHISRIDDNYQCFYLIIVDNEKAGAVKFLQSHEQLEILQLQIEPKCQGRGLGRNVVLKLLALAAKRPVRLTVLKGNPAFNLYQSLGFQVIGEDRYEFYMQADGLDDTSFLDCL